MNKKILATIISAVFVSLSAIGFVLADTSTSLDGCKINNTTRLPSTLTCQISNVGGTSYCLYSDGDCGMCCLLNGVYNATDWIFVILMAVASLMIIFGAVLFTTSQGDPEKTTKARSLILYAAVGIAVALFARAVPPVIKMIIGA
jgi:hypothetical protein